jgi:Tol biopolymer transport system component
MKRLPDACHLRAHWLRDQLGYHARNPETACPSRAPRSPDSRSLAFLYDNIGQPPKIHIRSLDGNETDDVMPAADLQLPTSWSSDGRFLAFINTGFPRSDSETQSDIWLFDLARNRTRIPLLTTQFHEANPVFSPDGKWLAFTSNESGNPELYIQPFRSGGQSALVGERHLVSSSGALAVRWRRDGKEIFYLDLNGRVQAVNVRLAPQTRVRPSHRTFHHQHRSQIGHPLRNWI